MGEVSIGRRRGRTDHSPLLPSVSEVEANGSRCVKNKVVTHVERAARGDTGRGDRGETGDGRSREWRSERRDVREDTGTHLKDFAGTGAPNDDF